MPDAFDRCRRTAGPLFLAPGLAGLLLLLGTTGSEAQILPRPGEKDLVFGGPLRYQVMATGGRVIRRAMGPIVAEVQGVPAEPVDSFGWDGRGVTPVEGQVIIEVDPVHEVGAIVATWTDQHGDWTYVQTQFIHPEHSSGVRIGSSAGEVDSLLNEGITHNVYLHGDTTAGQPVLPTVFNFLATWGPADVTLNGEPFLNPYELPAPQWLGHIMVTEGVRRRDGTVRTKLGEIYNPMKKSEGSVEPGDLEVHVVFHDERFPRTSSIPPLFSFFYHLNFEDVSIQIVQNDNLLELPSPIGPESDARSGVGPAGSRNGLGRR